jgi:hypothetical protein
MIGDSTPQKKLVHNFCFHNNSYESSESVNHDRANLKEMFQLYTQQFSKQLVVVDEVVSPSATLQPQKLQTEFCWEAT